jgi:predicted RNase H-related nuclease YkuK (DUF458 family)
MKTKGKSKERPRVKKVPEYAKKDPYKFDPVQSWVWRKYESSHKVDPVEFISEYRHRYFFVGTDSQNYPKSRKCVFTSVLIAWDYDPERGTGHGATAIRYVDKRPMIPVEALSSRLMVEAQRSIEICKLLEEHLFEFSIQDNVDSEHMYTQNIKGVTIDVNEDVKHRSGRYKDMLVGMIMAYGYNALCKPDAWASSSVADRKC